MSNLTPSDFWLEVLSNTVTTVIGVAAGIPAGQWVDRRKQRADDAKARAAAQARAQQERQAQSDRRKTIARLLSRALDANAGALNRAEADVGQDRYVFASYLDFQTWDVLKAQVIDHFEDPTLVAQLATHFARLRDFDEALAQRTRWPLEGFVGSRPIRDFLLQAGVELRYEGKIIDDALRRLLSAGSEP